MLLPVILSGGAGTRLWPLSRRDRPKQFLPLTESRTMFECTLGRVQGLPDLGPPIVVAGAAQAELVQEGLARVGCADAGILLEPCGRNTAPAVTVAAHYAQELAPDPLLLVLPADHVITDEAAFRTAVQRGRPLAEAGRLVTFGIVPTNAETGYGYIRAAVTGVDPVPVQAFVEKPDRTTAERYLADGQHLWNSGMFLFRASVWLAELARHRPDMVEPCRAALPATRSSVRALDREAFARCPSDSIDYAVMERTALASVVPLSAGWNDVGSWAALYEIAAGDAQANVLIGDVLDEASAGTYVRAEHRLVATVGLRDVVVVETADAVLVAVRDRVQDVKRIVDRLAAAGRPEAIGRAPSIPAPGSSASLGAEEIVLAEHPELVRRVQVAAGTRRREVVPPAVSRTVVPLQDPRAVHTHGPGAAYELEAGSTATCFVTIDAPIE